MTGFTSASRDSTSKSRRSNKPFSQSRQLTAQEIPPGAHVLIETARGSITVHGGDGHDLRAGVNESSPGANESAADARMKDVDVVVEQTANGYSVHPLHQNDFHGAVTVDLDVQVPKTANLTLHTSHGDINVSAIGGVVDARTENGDIEIHDAASDVFAQLQKGDARISGVGGNVTLKERGNDWEIADVVGDVTVDGPILGSTVVRKVGKTTRITSPWSDLTFERFERTSGIGRQTTSRSPTSPGPPEFKRVTRTSPRKTSRDSSTSSARTAMSKWFTRILRPLLSTSPTIPEAWTSPFRPNRVSRSPRSRDPAR